MSSFIAFVGRVLFVSVFVLSAWQEFNEFGTDGGPAAKTLAPKVDVFKKHVSAQIGFQVPHFELKQAVAAAISLKAIGSILFVLGSTFGAYVLLLHQLVFVPILYDCYNYDTNTKEFNQLFMKFIQNLALVGALFFFIGMKNSIPRRQLKKKAPKSKTS